MVGTGTWAAGTAQGYIYLTGQTGAFTKKTGTGTSSLNPAVGEDINVGGVKKAICKGNINSAYPNANGSFDSKEGEGTCYIITLED